MEKTEYPKIAFDIDGVIANIFPRTMRLLGKITGRKLNPPTTYYFDAELDIERKIVRGAFNQVIFDWTTEEVMEFAIDLIHHYHWKTKRKIFFITNRPRSLETETRQFLTMAIPGIPFEVTFVPHGDSKISILNSYKILVDDRRQTALEAEAAGIIAIMPETTYNKLPKPEDHPRIFRIKNRPEKLIEYLIDKCQI